jgi:hypothetical protein
MNDSLLTNLSRDLTCLLYEYCTTKTLITCLCINHQWYKRIRSNQLIWQRRFNINPDTYFEFASKILLFKWRAVPCRGIQWKVDDIGISPSLTLYKFCQFAINLHYVSLTFLTDVYVDVLLRLPRLKFLYIKSNEIIFNQPLIKNTSITNMEIWSDICPAILIESCPNLIQFRMSHLSPRTGKAL